MFFKTKPSCFGKHSETWAVCQDCNFKGMCISEKIILRSGSRPTHNKENASGGRNYFDKSDYSSANAIAEAEEFNSSSMEERDARGVPTSPYASTRTPYVPPRRPPRPKARLMYGAVGDVNLATMFGIGKYAELIGYMKPNDLLTEFKHILDEDDGYVRDKRIEIIKSAVQIGPPAMWKRFAKWLQRVEI